MTTPAGVLAGIDTDDGRRRRRRGQLEEATCGADALNLAAMFGIDDTTAIKCATIALQLLETAAEQHDPPAPADPSGSRNSAVTAP